MSSNFPTSKAVLTAVLAAVAATASAHPGHSHGAELPFASGFLHPAGGLDHLLAMLAVGAWGARLGGRMVWALPLCFVATMLLGSLAGFAGMPVPFVEHAIAASVLILGLLVAFAAKAPAAASVALVMAFAFFHGHAHGTEGVASLGYFAGFSLMTTALHLMGIGLAYLATEAIRTPGRELLVFRVGGLAMSVCGGLMLVGLL